MTTVIPASSLSLYDVSQKLGLRHIHGETMAPEWYGDLPSLTVAEQQHLDQIKSQYLHLAQRPCLETLVKMVVLSPLLALAGFYDPPFWVTAEESVELPVAEEAITLKGKVDVLVVQDRVWILAIEAKGGNYDVMLALPQALTYMMAASLSDPLRPCYGFALNGRELFFIKLLQRPNPVYGLSEVFSLSRRTNELYPVLQILKDLANRASRP
jgi:hypothetical protein